MHVSSATRRAKGTKSSGRRPKGKRDTGSGVMLWVVIGLFMIGGLIAAIVVMLNKNGTPKSTEPETAPPPTQPEKDKKDKDKVKDKDKDKDKKEKANG